jgi:hypothetical protein
MYVTAAAPNGAGETLTVTRAYLSTTAAAHLNNANIIKVNIPADVSLGESTFIIAGGGFRVCGAANLHAPHVMLYNTNDQVGVTVYDAIDQILLNTNRTVTLGRQTTGTYAGMTIFQDRTFLSQSG